MTREQIKAVLDRVLTWPENRQEEAANILIAMEEQDLDPPRLTDEQAAEVKRRMEEIAPRNLTWEEFESPLRRLKI